ncbi:MAG: Rrf2 family transcriptional regulator [Holophaga sp.]|nr:Rrf2 family transcriptional regulator [Holophaga sp.]
MRFLRKTAYALWVLADMPEDGTFTPAKVLAERLRFPALFLSKVLKTLVKRGILESSTGPRGGFRLALPAHRVTVGAVVAALEGSRTRPCVMGLAHCDRQDRPCVLHYGFDALVAHIDCAINQTTIRDLHLQAAGRQSA